MSPLGKDRDPPDPLPATDASEPDFPGATGLTAAEAARRLAAQGPNELPDRGATSSLRLAIGQLTSALVLLLLAGAVVSAAVGHWLDATAITVIVGVNAVVGFIQEFRAERAVVALRRMTAPRATVIRDGNPEVVAASAVVRGDILAIEPGDIVAADGRLVESHQLSVQEAVLTGESMPVDKSVGPTPPDTPLAERTGEVFMGTAVSAGTGRAEVTATGIDTEMGRIAAGLAEQSSSSTPLQQRLASLGRILVVACLALVGVVAGLAWMRGFHWLDVLLTSVSLAVAAVPEGLPAVVTIALAVGVHRMTRRHVLVRRLAAVETLGSATVICTDKTGTLTMGVMEVRDVWGADRRAVLFAAAAGSDATLGAEDEGTGDALELAILRAARAEDIERDEIERTAPRVKVEPFDAATRRMSITREDGQRYLKGAFEVVQQACATVPEGANAAHTEMTERGLRVLAIASGEPDALVMRGLIGVSDPPRPEALRAIAQARAAGVRVVMITGDHPKTARAIARELGLGQTDAELDEAVVARATATDKLEIVRRLRARGEVVAMTGDGVNDAPSIKEADIGVAMGRTATEVTREAADMVLTDDDLSGIVHAIREGRVIYANIRKTVVYLLAGNSAELILVLVATAVGLPMPLLPLQLLWINLLGEPLPGIALSIDPPHADVLEQPPRPPSEPLLGRKQWLEIGAVATLQAAVVFAAYRWALSVTDVVTARTVGFSALVFGVVFRALASRSSTKIYWELDPRDNPRLALVVAISAALQVAIVYFEPAQGVFGTAALSAGMLGLSLLLGLVPVTAVELYKLAKRRATRAP